jgi:hypothetical protein
MILIEEIKQRVQWMLPGNRVQIRNLPRGHEAWIELDESGCKIFAFIAVPQDAPIFRDDFSSIHLRMDNTIINNALIKTLRLESWDYENGKNVFSSICANFVDPKNRFLLKSDPASWCEEWKKQLGNSVKRRSPYDVIAELLVLLELQKNNIRSDWAGPKKGSHDILSDKMEIEVKSSTVRGAKLVHISSQYQAQSGSKLPLYLAFIGFEKSKNGILTIDSVVKDLSSAGFSKSTIDEGLRLCGYPEGKPERSRERYNRLEDKIQYYAVDERFPKITPESFVGGAIPQGINSLQYTVDLSGNLFTRLGLEGIIKSKRSKKYNISSRFDVKFEGRSTAVGNKKRTRSI